MYIYVDLYMIYIYSNRKELDCFAFKIKDVLTEGNAIFSIDVLHALYYVGFYIYIYKILHSLVYLSYHMYN